MVIESSILFWNLPLKMSVEDLYNRISSGASTRDLALAVDDDLCFKYGKDGH